MQIQVKLIGLFKTGRFAEQARTYPEESRVAEVVADLQLPRQHLGIVLINGRHAEEDAVLADGDELTLLPFVDGG